MRDPRWTLVAGLSCLTAVSLGLTGEITRLALLLPLAAVAGAWRERRADGAGRLLHAAFQVLALVALLYFTWRLARLDLLGGAVALTLPVQAYYLVLPREHSLLNRLQLMSFFQLVALAATTTKIFFGLALAAYLVFAPAALTLAALEAGQAVRRPLPLPRGLLRAGARAAAAGLLLGVVVFLLLPRYEAGFGRRLSGKEQRVSGFSGQVELGDIGRILQSDAVVMRVSVREPVAEPIRWRGGALAEFDGKGWRRGRPPSRTVRRRPGTTLLRIAPDPEGLRLVEQEFVLEPTQGRTIFALPGAVRVETQDFRDLEVDAFGGMQRWRPSRSRLRYSVWSAPEAPLGLEEDPELLERCLQLPEIDPRVHALAARVVEGIDEPAERAAALESYLQRAHAYSLDVRDFGLEDPVSSFLLERRAGHCEYFASGMVVLARSLGLPARLVNGFQAGDWSRWTRSFVVRERDAHAWVEVWLPARGWTAFDPTPFQEPGPEGTTDFLKDAWRHAQIFWDDHVVGFNLNHQLAALTTLGEWRDAARQALRSPTAEPALGGLALAALAGAGLLAWRGRRRPAGEPELRFYRDALRLLASRGFVRAPGQTPAELAAEAERRGGPAGRAAVELTRIYYAARFGGRAADLGEVERLLAELESLPDLRRAATPRT